MSEIANSPRPYTVSTLMGRFSKKDGAPDTATIYTLRLTALTEELASLLLDFAGTAVQATAELDHIPFRVLAAASKAEDQPWAGRASYASLGARFLPSSEVARRVTFQFTSPVVFKSGGLSQSLPTPALIFNSLLERWNAFAPLTFAPEVRRYVEECLAVSRFDLKSRAVPLKDGGLRIGAIGRVTLTATNPDKFWLGQIQTLAAFAQFAGLGAGTAQGLGQCRFIDD
jgi:CRISPR-associated endoribonuclease Cas6